jgi:hypothetical protein
MTPRESAVFGATSKNVTGLAIAFLVVAAFFGFLNSQKVKALRASAANAQAVRHAAERRQAQEKQNAPSGVTSGTEQQSKLSEAENRASKAEAELAQAQKEKTDLQAKLDANQQESSAESAQTAALQSQLDDLRRQVDSAEKEKAFLAEKIQDSQGPSSQPKETKKRRETASTQRETVSSQRAGVHGAVLAYNQAYNFVVLNLGARNGVETNSEMLVLRDGTLIGKIRISSVEPATAIGDIITNSVARGVQVQPGDSVIYAGTNP